MTQNIVNIVYIADENYLMPAAVSIVSAVLNKHTDTQYKIWVLTDSCDEESTNKYKKLNRNNTEVFLKKIDIDDFIPQNVERPTHVTRISLLKFFIPYIFNELNKILYLDCDTIVQADLFELYSENIGNNFVGAVYDYALARMPEIQHILEIPEDKYFNSGVMLMNLEKMRNEKSPEKLLDYKLKSFNRFMDQDAINKVFYPHILYLNWRYNYYQLSRDKRQGKDTLYCENLPSSFKESLNQAKIIHFTDKRKPWIYKKAFYSAFYKKYYMKSPYAKDKLVLKSWKRPYILKFVKYLFLENII